jgi:DNA-directed RNA polymerase specialized sigma24 family protein
MTQYPSYNNPLGDGKDIPDIRDYPPDSTEWLMMPNQVIVPVVDNDELIDTVREILSTLDDIDQQMIQLIYYERKTFQEAAQIVGIKAKSHAWRKTKSAMRKLETALRSNVGLMNLLEKKYEISLMRERD